MKTVIHDIIFSDWKQDSSEIIEIQDKDHRPIGALYLKTLNPIDVKITEATNMDEKYYLYYNGVAVFFSFWKKINYIDY